METKIIKQASLETLFGKLKTEGQKIYAPVLKNGKAEFKYNPDYKDVVYNHIQTVQSVKNVVFPKVENVFKFTSDKEGINLQPVDLSKIPEMVVWGSHPCDAVGFAQLKAIFMWDYKDEFLTARLQKLTIISLSCNECDSDCFCTSVGLNPGETKGSDLLLTNLKNNNFLVEIVTEKGKQLVEKYAELFENANGENKETVLAHVAPRFAHEKVTDTLKNFFDSPFWVENSLRCIGCGACAFVCPACACFDIQDETSGKNGKRLRCWDSCGFKLFTLHTSGHNPREVQSQRWRQRIMHKFSYMPERNESLGCVGCGRCSRACPVDMNISEQLAMIEKS